MTIKPHRDYVMILPDERGGTSPGGIVLPATWGPPPGSGTVMAVGAGRWVGGDWCATCNRKARLQWVPMDIRVGDQVAFRWIDVGEGRKFEHEGKQYYFLRRHEISGIVEQISESEPTKTPEEKAA